MNKLKKIFLDSKYPYCKKMRMSYMQKIKIHPTYLLLILFEPIIIKKFICFGVIK